LPARAASQGEHRGGISLLQEQEWEEQLQQEWEEREEEVRRVGSLLAWSPLSSRDGGLECMWGR